MKRRDPARTAAVFALLAPLALGVAPGCSGNGKDPNGPSRPLPGYSGHAVEVFDDTIEPAAVNLDADRAYTPKTAPRLRERAQLADGIVRVKVTTVTAKTDGPDKLFQIGLHPV